MSWTFQSLPFLPAEGAVLEGERRPSSWLRMDHDCDVGYELARKFVARLARGKLPSLVWIIKHMIYAGRTSVEAGFTNARTCWISRDFSPSSR